MSIDDNWHVGIDGRAGPHREPIPEAQAEFDRLTAENVRLRARELEHSQAYETTIEELRARITELERELNNIADLAARYRAAYPHFHAEPGGTELRWLLNAAMRAREPDDG